MTEVTSNVGNKVVFENDEIKVWDFILEPGQSTDMHKHDKSYIWYAIHGGPLDLDDNDGNDLGILDVPTGSVWDIKCHGDKLEVMSEINHGAMFPATHRAKNAGDTPYREILVEFKE